MPHTPTRKEAPALALPPHAFLPHEESTAPCLTATFRTKCMSCGAPS